jgi:hypothetical protein
VSQTATNELLFQSPPTLRRGFNGFCTIKEKIIVSGAKARRPLRQAQGGLIQQLRVNSPLTPVPDSTTAAQPSDDEPSRFRR